MPCSNRAWECWRSRQRQKDSFTRAAETGNGLLVQVKQNQPTLHEALARLCAEHRPFDSHETVDRRRHGRQEHRLVEVFDTAGQLDPEWQPLIACVARVSRLDLRERHPVRSVAIA
jgi:hypothetical protein